MTAKKANLPAFATLKRRAFENLKRDYLAQLNAEIKKAGGATQLAAALGMSGHYVRMVKLRGSLGVLKNCIELIAQELYGWKLENKQETKKNDNFRNCKL